MIINLNKSHKEKCLKEVRIKLSASPLLLYMIHLKMKLISTSLVTKMNKLSIFKRIYVIVKINSCRSAAKKINLPKF